MFYRKRKIEQEANSNGDINRMNKINAYKWARYKMHKTRNGS